MRPGLSRELLLISPPLVAFAVLFALFFGRTDLTVDEAYHSIYSHQIAIILHSEFIFVLAGIAVALALAYLILVRRNLYLTVALAIATIGARFAFNLPTGIHNIHPPFFNALNALVMLFLSADIFAAQPHVTGIMISAASVVFISVSTFLVARRLWGLRMAAMTTALLLVSPVAIFYSTTSLLNPLAVCLAYSSMMFFLLGLRRTALLPFSGFLMAAAIWTRFDVLPVLLGFAALAAMNRKTLVGNEHRRNFAIFCVIIFAAVVVQAPAMMRSFETYSTWLQHETYSVEIAHYSSYITDAMGSNPLQISRDFYIKLISTFYTPLILFTFAAGLALAFRRKNHDLLAIGMLGILYMVGFSLSNIIQTDRYMMFFDFPMILLTGFFLASMPKKGRTRFLPYALFAVMAALFLYSNYAVIGSHNFTGVSDFLKGVPNNSVIYSDQPDVILYHSSGYLCKLAGCANDPEFWGRFIPEDIQKNHNISVKFSYGFEKIKLMKMSDYFIISEYFFGRAPEDHKNYLLSLNRCGSVLHNQVVMFEFYARGRCPLNKTIRA